MTVVSGRVAAALLVAAFLGVAAAALRTARVLGAASQDSHVALRARSRALPRNPAPRRRLARAELAGGNPQAALRRLEAVQLDAPFAAEVWLERAEAALQAGHADEARRAALRAVALAPVDAAGCGRAALVLLQLNEAAAAEPLLHCQMAYSDRAREVLDLAHAVYADERVVLADVVPPDGLHVRRYLGWAYDRDYVEAAIVGWEALATHAPTSPERLRHIDFLVRHGAMAAADAMWTAAYGPHPPGRVYDGDFEGDPVGAGFGWNMQEMDGARIALTAGAAARGRRGLSIEFRGGNLAFGHVWQVVPVLPERRYRLSALVHVEGVTSFSGPRLRIDPHVSCPGLVGGDSSELRGTRAWGPIGVEFATPPGCQAIIVRIVRPPTDRMDRDLRGRLDVDDVTLVEMGNSLAAPEGAS
jgi:hypothetical protein